MQNELILFTDVLIQRAFNTLYQRVKWLKTEEFMLPLVEKAMLSFSHPLLLSDQFLSKAGGLGDNLLCWMKQTWHFAAIAIRNSSRVALKANIFLQWGKCAHEFPQLAF